MLGGTSNRKGRGVHGHFYVYLALMKVEVEALDDLITHTILL